MANAEDHGFRLTRPAHGSSKPGMKTGKKPSPDETRQQQQQHQPLLLRGPQEEYNSGDGTSSPSSSPTLGPSSHHQQQLYEWEEDPRSSQPRICILGGGFGGLYTALHLDSLVWASGRRPQVLLVDQSERFVFKPLLYELLTGEVDPWEVAPRLPDLLARTRTRYLRGKVRAVVAAAAPLPGKEDAGGGGGGGGTVVLDGGTRVQYDWLLLGLGARSRTDLVPGAASHALPFGTLEDAMEVDARLQQALLERRRRRRTGAGAPEAAEEEPVSVLVVGAGYSGVELAATVAQRLGARGRVRVVGAASTVCPAAPRGNRDAAMRVLAARNVDLRLGYTVTGIRSAPAEDAAPAPADGSNGPVVVDLKPVDALDQEAGGTGGTGGTGGGRRAQEEQVHADMVLWTVGTSATVPAGHGTGNAPAFPVTGRGQADTDSTLRVRGHPRVFAVGDAAGVPTDDDGAGTRVPATAQAAFQQAQCAGDNLWAAIHGRSLRHFKYRHLGEMMTLGKYHAVVTATAPWAGGRGFTMDGLVGHTARKLTYLMRLPTGGHRLRVGLSWVLKTAADSVAFAQGKVAGVVHPALGRTQLVCFQGGRLHLLCSAHEPPRLA